MVGVDVEQCKADKCRELIKTCIEAMKTSTGFNEAAYKAKVGNLVSTGKYDRHWAYAIICQLTSKGVNHINKTKDFEMAQDKSKKAIYERLYVKKTDVEAAREKRKAELDMKHPYRPKINVVPKSMSEMRIPTVMRK